MKTNLSRLNAAIVAATLLVSLRAFADAPQITHIAVKFMKGRASGTAARDSWRWSSARPAPTPRPPRTSWRRAPRSRACARCSHPRTSGAA